MKILLLLLLTFGFSAAQPLPPPQPRADDGTVIDVMVLYTQNARAIAGGADAQAVGLIENAVTGANSAFDVAGVLTQLNVVLYQPVFYLEQVNEDFHADLTNLSGAGDGYLDEIHALRDYYAADVVLMVTGTWFYIYTGDSHLTPVPAAAQGFAVLEAKGLDDGGGIYPAQWIARLLGVDDVPPYDAGQAATMNANRVAVANYRDSADRALTPLLLTQNSGFEIDMDDDSVPDFWAAKGWAAGDKRICSKPSKVHEGACSVRIKLEDGGRLIQAVDGGAINLQDELTLSGQMLASQGGSCVKAILVVSFETSPSSKTVTNNCLISGGYWGEFTVAAVPDGQVSAVKAKIKAYGEGKLWLDDVQLVAGPPSARGGGR